MLIAPAKGSESASRPDPGTFDAALVVVHGMGNAFKSQILLEWAEPLLERMDWVARDRIIEKFLSQTPRSFAAAWTADGVPMAMSADAAMSRPARPPQRRTARFESVPTSFTGIPPSCAVTIRRGPT